MNNNHSTLHLFLELSEQDSEYNSPDVQYRSTQLSGQICAQSELTQLIHVRNLIDCRGFYVVDATLSKIKQLTEYESVKDMIKILENKKEQ